MPMPTAFSKAPLPLAMALSSGPTQQSKLSHPGPRGFSAGSAGFCSAAGGGCASAAWLLSADNMQTTSNNNGNTLCFISQLLLKLTTCLLTSQQIESMKRKIY